MVEGAPAILYLDRPDELSTNLYTSPQIVDLLGYSVEEWMHDAELWVRSLHPADRERVVQEHRSSNADRRAIHVRVPDPRERRARGVDPRRGGARGRRGRLDPCTGVA